MTNRRRTPQERRA